MKVDFLYGSFKLKRAVLILFLICPASCFTSFGQIGSILPPDSLVCAPQGVFTIPAAYPASLPIPPGYLTSIGYSTTSIPIALITPGGTSVALADDDFAGSFPIGFSFNYFGNNYTSFYISANGYIGFTAPLPNYFNVDLAVMDANPCDASYPTNAIFGLFQDFDPNGAPNIIRYQTVGTAPYRKLIVSFSNIPFFGTECTGANSTFQIQLHETTNIIQIHIPNKPACPDLWSGQTRSGLVPPCPQSSAYSCGSYGINGVDAGVSGRAWEYVPVLPGSNVSATYTGTQWTCILGNGSITTLTSTPTSAQVNLFTASQAPKRYIIEVTYSIPCGENIVLKDTFTLGLRQHDATFTATSPICAGSPSSVLYTGTPIPAASATFAWNFDSGAASPGTGTGPHSVTWPSTGTKNVSLTISGSGCATGNFSVPVEVIPPPTSDFTATPSVCGATASVASYSGNAPASASYSWDFDGGVATPSTGQGPFSISWSTPGSKNIRLTVSAGSCNSPQTTHQVNVDAPPSGTFAVSPSGICAGNNTVVTFTGNSPASATYTWNFDGGTASPASGPGPLNVTWATPGTKLITLQVNDAGCLSVLSTRSIVVYGIPESSVAVVDSVCPLENSTISLGVPASNGATFLWSWDGGTLVSGLGTGPYLINWNTPGFKNVTVQVTSSEGCVSPTSTSVVTVLPQPASGFSVNAANVCAGEEAFITADNAGSSTIYNWSFNGALLIPAGQPLLSRLAG